MHACWILLCMLLNIVSYVCLLIKEGNDKSTESKGGIEGSMPRLVGGWGCYRLVSELLVETPGQYGLGMLVKVSWSRSNSNHEVEKFKRNGVAESTQEIERQRSVVRGSKDRDHPPSNSGVIATVGLGEIHDHWIGGWVNRDHLMKRKRGLRSQPSDPMGE
jgi:hypothetical protein